MEATHLIFRTPTWRQVLSYWPLSVAAILVGVSAAAVAATSLPRVYSATLEGVVYAEPMLAEPTIKDYTAANSYALSRTAIAQELVTSDVVLEFVIKELDLPVSVEQLAGDVSATSALDSPLVNITADAAAPADAVTIAESVARGLNEALRADAQSNDTAVVEARFSVLSPASSADEPAEPRLAPMISGGAVVGLAIGLLLMFTMAGLRRGEDSASTLVDAIDAPVLGAVRRQLGGSSRRAVAVATETTERIRIIATRATALMSSLRAPSIAFVATQAALQSDAGEVTLRIGEEIAKEGLRVAVVDISDAVDSDLVSTGERVSILSSSSLGWKASSNAITAESVAVVLADLEGNHDVVLWLVPCPDRSASAVSVASSVECRIAILDRARDSDSDARDLARMIAAIGTGLNGVLLLNVANDELGWDLGGAPGRRADNKG